MTQLRLWHNTIQLVSHLDEHAQKRLCSIAKLALAIVDALHMGDEVLVHHGNSGIDRPYADIFRFDILQERQQQRQTCDLSACLQAPTDDGLMAAEITKAIIDHLLGEGLKAFISRVCHGQRYRSFPEGRRLLAHLIIPGFQQLHIQRRQLLDDVMPHGLGEEVQQALRKAATCQFFIGG